MYSFNLTVVVKLKSEERFQNNASKWVVLSYCNSFACVSVHLACVGLLVWHIFWYNVINWSTTRSWPRSHLLFFPWRMSTSNPCDLAKMFILNCIVVTVSFLTPLLWRSSQCDPFKTPQIHIRTYKWSAQSKLIHIVMWLNSTCSIK